MGPCRASCHRGPPRAALRPKRWPDPASPSPPDSPCAPSSACSVVDDTVSAVLVQKPRRTTRPHRLAIVQAPLGDRPPSCVRLEYVGNWMRQYSQMGVDLLPYESTEGAQRGAAAWHRRDVSRQHAHPCCMLPTPCASGVDEGQKPTRRATRCAPHHPRRARSANSCAATLPSRWRRLASTLKLSDSASDRRVPRCQAWSALSTRATRA